MGRRERITRQTEDDLPAPPASDWEISPAFGRRDFFRQLQANTVNTIYDVAQLADGNPGISRGKIEVPEKTRLPASVLTALGQPSDEKAAADNIPFRRLRISDHCGACGYCAFFCPTQALQAENDGARFALKFNEAHCTGCDLCVDVCTEDAISREKRIALKEALSDESKTIFFREKAGRPAGGRETAWSDLLTYLYH